MTDGQILHWFPYAVPVVFVGMWLLVTAMLGLMSGWFNLQQWYPDDGSEEPLLRLRWQSGMMGMGVRLNNCLTLSAKPSGLSIRMTRIFALFQRPLLIPWGEITAEPSQMFFMPMVKLSFGNPATGKLKISARSWSKLVGAVPQSGAGAGGVQLQMPDVPAISTASIARGMVFEWLVLAAFVSIFLLFVTRAAPAGSQSPLAVAFLPAAALAIAQLIRFARQV